MIKFLILFFLILRIQTANYDPRISLQTNNKAISDCNYTFDEAVSGLDIPKSILNNLALVNVEYYSFDDKIHKGQIVVNKTVVSEIKEIFEFIKKNKFPINKVIPIVKYKWSDEVSMNDNNTSAFNYRKVKGQKVLSPHANGLAIDINPMQNPHVKSNKSIPPQALYNSKEPGSILKDSQLVKEFQKRGWNWGGFWKSSKDYQHFEKQ
jgi:peptidoglycan LD-endopeptidase CwlK